MFRIDDDEITKYRKSNLRDQFTSKNRTVCTFPRETSRGRIQRKTAQKFYFYGARHLVTDNFVQML